VPQPLLFISECDEETKSEVPKKVSWVRVSLKMISLARELCVVEEQGQDERCLFRGRVYRKKATALKGVLGSSLGDQGLFGSADKLCRSCQTDCKHREEIGSEDGKRTGKKGKMILQVNVIKEFVRK
jgi:hypothetical protein